jgi:Type II secretion system (T2SS), protein E, N-terminal domain
VHIVLRSGDTVDGGIYLTDGQALAPYLSSRKNGWVNIVNAAWGLEGELHGHAVLQTEHIVLASSTERDYPVVAPTQGGAPRAVDVLLNDGTRLQGSLVLGAKQRLSDYLAGTGIFLGLMSAVRVQDGDLLGDVALNAGAVIAVRDAKVFAAESGPDEADAKEEWGGLRRTSLRPEAVPPTHERVVRPSGAIDVVTPGHPNDRRRAEATPSGPPAIPSGATRAPAMVAGEPTAPAPPALSASEARREAAVARHWLTLLAKEAQLAPPDGRDLSDAPTLEEVWNSIASRNDMADAELAVVVATSYKLEMADLDQVTPAAIKVVPEKVARRLGVLPIKVDGRFFVVAVSDPESLEIEQQLAFVTKRDLRRAIATPADLAGAIDWYYGEAARAP